MDFFDEINTFKWFFVAFVGEPGDTVLRIRIEEARADGPLVDHSIAGTVLRARGVETIDGCVRFDILFNTYIAYAVTNESYAANSKDDEYRGRRARIYSKSAFLDFVGEGTLTTNDHPTPLTHYGFGAENHIVDVVSCRPPEVERSIVATKPE